MQELQMRENSVSTVMTISKGLQTTHKPSQHTQGTQSDIVLSTNGRYSANIQAKIRKAIRRTSFHFKDKDKGLKQLTNSFAKMRQKPNQKDQQCKKCESFRNINQQLEKIINFHKQQVQRLEFKCKMYEKISQSSKGTIRCYQIIAKQHQQDADIVLEALKLEDITKIAELKPKFSNEKSKLSLIFQEIVEAVKFIADESQKKAFVAIIRLKKQSASLLKDAAKFPQNSLQAKVIELIKPVMKEQH